MEFEEEEEEEASALRISSVESCLEIETSETFNDSQNNKGDSFEIRYNNLIASESEVNSDIDANKSSENSKLSCNETEVFCHGYLGFQKDNFF